jgi:hypothetical protein
LIFLLIFSLGTYLKQNINSAAWLLFAVLSALGFYTIPVMLYPFGIVVTWLFLEIVFENINLSRPQLLKKLIVSTVIVTLLTFMLYSPVFVVSGLESVVANRFVTAQSWPHFCERLPGFVQSLWHGWNDHVPVVMRFLLVLGFLSSLFFHRRLATYRIPIILAVMIWLIVVLAIHPVIRYTRVWLFLLPLYIILASTGISHFFTPIKSKIADHASSVFSILAVTLSLWLGLNVVATRSVYWNMKWSPPEAEPITIFLQGYLKPGDAVLCHSHLDVPLAYYFNVYDIPPKYLAPDAASNKRILIIVYEPGGQTPQYILGKNGFMTTVREPGGQTPQQVLAKNGFMTTTLGALKAIKRYGTFTLYVIPRAKVENRVDKET